jgi:hypothetical protein
MKRYISIILALCIFFMSIPAFALDFLNNSSIVLNMSFESVMTNTSPSGISLTNAYAYVRDTDTELNKNLEVAKVAKAASIVFSLGGQSDSMNFSFDFLMKDMLVTRSIGVKDSASLMGTVATIDTDGTVYANDGRAISKLECDKWYNISFVARFGDNRASLYIDGKCVASNILLETTGKFAVATSLIISMGSGGFGSTVYFDNLYVVTLPAAIMIYDENTDSVYLGTAGDILTYKTSGADASRFFVRFYKDNLNTVFIFKR